MNTLCYALRAFLALVVAIAAAAVPVAHAAVGTRGLPDDSIYRLDLPLVDQDGHPFHLADRRGRVQLVSMFYSSCPYTCPLIIDTLRMTQKALPVADRKKVDVLMVSLDPVRDTPARLKQVYGERKLDPAGWTLARAEAPNVRKLAAILGIQYRALSDGSFNHSASLLLLDADGRIVGHSDKMSAIDAEFIAAIEQTLDAH